MIELIFVIVIISILAGTALYKLKGIRDDAEAATCVHEVKQLISEISVYYTKVGNSTFQITSVSKMTNVNIGDANTTKGFQGDDKVHGAGVTYVCDGQSIVTFKGANAGTDYDLHVSLVDLGTGGTPASAIASEGIKKNILNGATFKVLKL